MPVQTFTTSGQELEIRLPGEPAIHVGGRTASLIRYLLRSTRQLDDAAYGALNIEWTPKAIKYNLARSTHETLT